MSFRPLMIISDMGSVGPSRAQLLLPILQKSKQLSIIEISHEVPMSDLGLASYYLKCVLNSAIEPCIVLAAVNNFYGPSPEYIVFQHQEHCFIGPNHGLFTLLYDDINAEDVYSVKISPETPTLESVYAHAVNCLHHGLLPSDIGVKIDRLELKLLFRPVITPDTIRATIIHIDNYGNVVTNLTEASFTKSRNGRNYHIFYSPHDPLHKVSKHYGEVPYGEVLALFNDAGHLEIAVSQGNASTQLNLFKNETIQIDFYEG